MNGRPYDYPVETVRYGVSFGTALAIAISYVNNQSILWAIIHGFFSWFYVIYSRCSARAEAAPSPRLPQPRRPARRNRDRAGSRHRRG